MKRAGYSGMRAFNSAWFRGRRRAAGAAARPRAPPRRRRGTAVIRRALKQPRMVSSPSGHARAHIQLRLARLERHRGDGAAEGRRRRRRATRSRQAERGERTTAAHHCFWCKLTRNRTQWSRKAWTAENALLKCTQWCARRGYILCAPRASLRARAAAGGSPTARRGLAGGAPAPRAARCRTGARRRRRSSSRWPTS